MASPILIRNAASDEIVDVIEQGAIRADSDMLKHMLAVGRSLKPVAYDAHIGIVRDMYENRQTGRLRSLLLEKYPNVARQMSPTPINIVKPSADIDSQAYPKPPMRWIENDDGETIEDARADRFQRLLRNMKIDKVLPEVERRTMAAKTCFVRISSTRAGGNVGRPPRIELKPFWPCDVHVIPSPGATADLWAAHAVLSRVQGEPDDVKGEEWWTLYRRLGAFDGADDERELGPIIIETLSTEGRTRGAAQVWHTLDMPWVVFHDGLATESVFLDTDRDIVAIQDAVNCESTDWFWKSAIQGHKQAWAAGENLDAKKGQTHAVGPGTIMTFPGATQVGVFDNAINKVPLEGLETMMGMYANSRRQPKDAWSTKHGERLSALSRVVMNEPSNRKRGERTNVFTDVEQSDLLPIAIRLADERIFDELGGLIGDVMPRVQFPLPSETKDPQIATQNAAIAQDRGWISPAKAAVEAGYYPTLEAALEAGVSDQIEVKEDVSGMARREDQGGPIQGPGDAQEGEREDSQAEPEGQ